MSIILGRKILASIFSSVLFALIFSVLTGFDMNAFVNLYYLNFMFVVTYGVITSIFSDWLSKKLFTSNTNREIASFFFHCLFGSVLKELSLVSAVSFFIIDRLLTKVKIRWWSISIALFVIVLIFIIVIYIDFL
ncbi:hypothetical protein P2R12_07700 [Cytobacillus oceanisediminis]|uniref:hypothetical protein n=1 Tax=Cytobacillus oceanisediminis TaxID=665099 RepID=UPI0023DB9981|nr:hypothetical protein [Cytobacillus oceanisediminis]MDF2036856.1 hypothetical protein [Cytobacillus oceanisediminis]